MLILTNCLAERTDEGSVKLAKTLIKRIKNKDSSAYIVTYDRKSEISDIHLKLNKFLLNKKLADIIKSKNDNVLYVPFPAKTISTAIRVFILSLLVKRKLTVIMTQRYHYNFVAKYLLKLSNADLIVFSADARDFYGKFINKNKIRYIKTGVDTEKFSPVSFDKKLTLREKYGFAADKKIILHCGHLNYGRNVDKLLKIDEHYQVLLVVSTLTRNEQDPELKLKLKSRSNITIIDDYIENIEEIYQLSDVYFFPVQELGKCIDVPLSCLEAASCNLPVITTGFGEMRELNGRDGFVFIDDFDSNTINSLIEKSLASKETSRNSVFEYDWNVGVKSLLENI